MVESQVKVSEQSGNFNWQPYISKTGKSGTISQTRLIHRIGPGCGIGGVCGTSCESYIYTQKNN